MMQDIIYGIPLEITKKRVKYLIITVKSPGGIVMISAPYGIDRSVIENFVFKKRDWIIKQQKLLTSSISEKPIEYNMGDKIILWGNEYNLQVEYISRGQRAELSGSAIILSVNEHSTAEQRERIINEFYRKELQAKILEILPLWEDRTMLYSKKVKIRDMKSRWGSCNIKTKQITFNLKLAKKPFQCLHYVILHELMHLKIRNHSKEFYRYITMYMPDYKTVQNMMKTL